MTAPTPQLDSHSGARTMRNLLVTLALIVVTIAIYWPVRNHEFINFDDDVYITDNAMVRQGLTSSGIAWAFTTFAAANWHPVTWLSHMLDVSLFGGKAESAGGHHFTNLIIHAVNAALLLWLLAAMTGAFWRSSLVAALFALHPLHVESVAWVAERKDVLSTFFGLLTLLTYVRFARLRDDTSGSMQPIALTYILMLVFFALGLMSKPMLVTLPFVMLLLDAWPLRRWLLPGNRSVSPPSPIQLILEKIPLLIMSAASSVVTMMAQSRSGAVWSTESLSIPARLANASVAYSQYLKQTFWPSGLALIYPLPGETVSWHAALAVCALITITIFCAMSWKRRPWLLIGWLWFLGMLVPVIGIVQVGPQARADRYTYVPLIGIFIMLAWSLPAITRTVAPARNSKSVRGGAATAESLQTHPSSTVSPAVGSVIAFVCIAALIASGVVTSVYLQHWRTSVALFAHVLQVTEKNSIAHGNMAAALANLDPPDLEGAIHHNEQALIFWPQNAKAAKNLGNALVAAGQAGQAIEFLNRAIAIKPNYVEAISDLGAAYGRMGQSAMAIEQYQRALTIDPNFVEAQSNLGGALVALNRPAEAIPFLEKAIALRPDYARARFNLAAALGEIGQIDRSITEFQRTLALNPNLQDARFNLGMMYMRANRHADAVTTFRELIRINPSHAMAHNSLARALALTGQSAAAVAEMRIVLQLAPDNPSAMNNLAMLLLDAEDVGARNPAEAVTISERAVELTNRQDPGVLITLSRAQAATGDLPAALASAQTALPLIQASGNAELLESLRRRIEAYRAGRASP